MTGSTSEYSPPTASGPGTRRLACAVLGGACALVIGVYVWSAQPGSVQSGKLSAHEAYYNLLVQGFRAGQLDLKREVPSELASRLVAQAPAAQRPYWYMDQQVLDLSYFQGKLYLYFGVAPALVLFWPYAVLTGHYLPHQVAVVTFFSLGFLAGAMLLWAAWRRYFSEVGIAAMGAGVLAFGLISLMPAILQRCDVYEVAVSCGSALTMVTLGLLWQALHDSRRPGWWVAAASLAYGLALGARPSLLLGAVILLVPMALIWGRQAASGPRPQLRSWLLTATAPIMIVGLGLLFYNYLRFDQPIEFGQRYQVPAGPRQQFSLDYLWFNFRVSFLEPARWSAHFPFVHGIAVPPSPRGSGGVFDAFGVLSNIPVVWLALAAPLAWHNRSPAARSMWGWYLVAVLLVSGTSAWVLCLHDSINLRYEVEFASALSLLAVIGIFGLERAFACQPDRCRLVHCGWGMLLVFSVSFNLLAVVEQASEACVSSGVICSERGQMDDAMDYYRKALKLQPDSARAFCNLGAALFQQGKLAEAAGCFEQALRVDPDFVEAHHNLGEVLSELGRVTEAIRHYEGALRGRPGFAEAHVSLALALRQQGKVAEAIGHLEQAIRLKPDCAEAHNNLGVILLQQGKVAEAIGHLQQALHCKPDYDDAHYNLGCAFFQKGNVSEAVGHLEQALRLRPRDFELKNKLAWVLATGGDAKLRDGKRAVELAEEADKAAGGKDPAVLDTMAAAYAEVGRFGDGARAAQAAIGLLQANGRAEQARMVQKRLMLYQAGQPYHERSPAAP